MSSTPIVYKASVPVRFADLDPYGHVNASNYLDYIVSSRWMFARERFGFTDKLFFERGVGFYMSRADISFQRPIAGMQNLVVTSSATEVQDSKISVRSEIKSEDESKVFSRASLEFSVIDLKTNRPVPCPDWILALFFE